MKLYKEFICACDNLVLNYEITSIKKIDINKHELIFEGSQGIMLDMNYGFFPHVTRSNTTSKNAMEFIKKYEFSISNINIYYITRAYLTRHGNGYLPNEKMSSLITVDNPLETNILGFQGEFRKTVLDLDILNYAINCDTYYHDFQKIKKKMVITCLDQMPELIPIISHNKLEYLKYKDISNICGISDIYPVYSDIGYQYTLDNY